MKALWSVRAIFIVSICLCVGCSIGPRLPPAVIAALPTHPIVWTNFGTGWDQEGSVYSLDRANITTLENGNRLIWWRRYDTRLRRNFDSQSEFTKDGHCRKKITLTYDGDSNLVGEEHRASDWRIAESSWETTIWNYLFAKRAGGDMNGPGRER
jgi:hypothetical protein